MFEVPLCWWVPNVSNFASNSVCYFVLSAMSFACCVLVCLNMVKGFFLKESESVWEDSLENKITLHRSPLFPLKSNQAKKGRKNMKKTMAKTHAARVMFPPGGPLGPLFPLLGLGLEPQLHRAARGPKRRFGKWKSHGFLGSSRKNQNISPQQKGDKW